MPTHLDDEQVPGTVYLVDVKGQAGASMHDASHKDVVLVPRPSADPEDPLNWSHQRKIMAVSMTYLYVIGTGIATSLQYSVLPDITRDTGISTANLVQGTGVMFLFLGWACLLWQPLALTYGRRGVYLISMLLTVPVMVWTAYSSSSGEWFAHRILIGIIVSPIESLPEVTVFDVFFAHNRGTYMGLYVFILFGSNFLAPLVAGWFNDAYGWRWTMNFGAILCAVCFVIMFFLMEETIYFRDTTIEGKDLDESDKYAMAAASDPEKAFIEGKIPSLNPATTRSDNIPSLSPGSTADHNAPSLAPPSENMDNIPTLSPPGPSSAGAPSFTTPPSDRETIPSLQPGIQSKTASSSIEKSDASTSHTTAKSRRAKYAIFTALPGRPSNMAMLRMTYRPLLMIPALPTVLWSGFLYGINLSWYNVLNGTTSPVLSAAPYNWSAALIGCVYTGPLLGAAFASLWAGNAADWLALRLARRNGGVREPEHRLWVLAVSGILSAAGLITWGVGADAGVHWIGLVFGLGMLTFGCVTGGSIAVSYNVDCFKEIGGETTGSVMVIRNTIGFGISYAITPWYTNQGLQNCFITAGMVSIACTFTFLLMIKWGKSLRRWSIPAYRKFVATTAVQHE
ncbi:hypothetical protein CAC42_7269 [Sphaceloma murrayae]|uniref:Major facilitator superfamily (MFS) profile domain-containing protein n=1 Tax=Sphaceloma murrayae TaxID=2082308 RepID=A0A2K1QQ58_9PEZI|nr:hypothetical protein CAC42_7269 [Sphaceloma murrayae]